MVTAVTYIEQIGFNLFTVSEIQSSFYRESTAAENQQEFNRSSDFSMYGLPLAQNPTPYGRGLIETADPESWSDSITSDPDLLIWKRYAYGRGTGDNPGLGYGSLSNDSGLLMRQVIFSIGRTSDCIQSNYHNYGSVIQENFEKSSIVSEIQNFVVSSDSDVTQFNFLLYAIPIPYSYKNPVDSSLFIRMSNYGSYPLDPTTSILVLDGIRYETDSLTVVPFYAGAGGLEVSWANIREFFYGRRIDVYWEFYDTDSPPNKIMIKYWFCTVEDLIGPRIINESPVEDSTGSFITTYVSFDILDYEAGVEISTLRVYVNNMLIVSGLTIVRITDGYRVQYIPVNPFVYGDVVPVAVFVSDKSDKVNTSFRAWSFSVEGSLPPLLINMDPSPCSRNVSRVGNVSFEVVDAGHGIQSGSIVLGINNQRKDDVLIIPIIHRFI